MIHNLSEPEIARVLSYERLIPAMERALIAFSAGEVIQPVRTMLTIEEAQRFLAVMPAVMQDAMGAKLVCFYPKNAASGNSASALSATTLGAEVSHSGDRNGMPRSAASVVSDAASVVVASSRA